MINIGYALEKTRAICHCCPVALGFSQSPLPCIEPRISCMQSRYSTELQAHPTFFNLSMYRGHRRNKQLLQSQERYVSSCIFACMEYCVCVCDWKERCWELEGSPIYHVGAGWPALIHCSESLGVTWRFFSFQPASYIEFPLVAPSQTSFSIPYKLTKTHPVLSCFEGPPRTWTAMLTLSPGNSSRSLTPFGDSVTCRY